MITWLENHGLEYSADLIKLELIEKNKSVRGHYDKYVVDNAAEKAGHTLLRLPLCHCSLNMTELIWSRVKGYVARSNTSFKLQDMRPLLQTAVQKVTADDWKNCIFTLKEEDSLCQIDGLTKTDVERLVITNNRI
jgi:hypothetical protein